MAAVEIDAMDAARNLVVNVRVKNIGTLMVRLWLGAKIIRFGAWVSGMEVVDVTDKEPS